MGQNFDESITLKEVESAPYDKRSFAVLRGGSQIGFVYETRATRPHRASWVWSNMNDTASGGGSSQEDAIAGLCAAVGAAYLTTKPADALAEVRALEAKFAERRDKARHRLDAAELEKEKAYIDLMCCGAAFYDIKALREKLEGL